MASNPFNRTGRLKPRRNVFDLSYRKNFTCDMGQLIPIMADEVVPGDFLKIGNETVIRFQPLAAPIMHEITCTVHYFFVPYRILWEQWEDFISQGQLAGDTPLPIPLPRYPMSAIGQTAIVGKLWDYFGLPITDMTSSSPSVSPMDMPWRAYNTIYNEYYRDQDLQLEVDLLNNDVLNRNWKKDYFTAARPFLQKGQAPALPVNIDANMTFNWASQAPSTRVPVNVYQGSLSSGSSRGPVLGDPAMFNEPFADPNSIQNLRTTNAMTAGGGVANFGVSGNDIGGSVVTGLQADVNATATTFNVSDLRLAFQTQKWLERNARAGTRYTEFLQSHFGVSPSDARLDRPEYIGGTKVPIIVSEVLQTSQTTQNSQLGNMGGHGLAADGQFAGSYNVQEYGIIVGLLSVMPKPSYQDGINRQWLRKLPTDFYFPEFAHLSEQAITQAEINYTFGSQNDNQVFGYVGQYDEMRVKHDMVCSEMRKLAGGQDQLSYWNLTRKFPVNTPVMLNSNFITCVPRKDIFLVDNVPGLIVNCQNLIRAVRPLPLIAEPGLIDHF